MKKVFFLTMLGLVALAAPTFDLDQPLQASQCLPCSLGASNESTLTATFSTNTDCEWARMGARGLLRDRADCPDGFCVEVFETLQDCSDSDPGPWLVRMRLTYRCLECMQQPSL